MNDLKLNVVEFTPTPIKWNESEVSKVIAGIVSKYKGVEFNEENIESAKNDRASLNKVAKNLSTKRIDIKKLYSTELTLFEDSVKLLEKKVKDTSDAIDKQIKAFEGKEKQQKQDAIIELAEYVKVKDHIVFNEEWLNKSFKFDDVIKELEEFSTQIDKDKNIIKMACADKDFESDKYIDKLKQMELASVLMRINEDYDLVNTKPVEEVKETIVPEEIKDEPVRDIVRHIKGTKTQLIKLRDYANKIGVEIYE